MTAERLDPEAALAPQPDSEAAATSGSAAGIGAWALPLITLGFSIGVMPGLFFVVMLLVFTGIAFATGGFGGAALIGFLATIVGGGFIAQQPWLLIVPVAIGVLLFVAGIRGSVLALRRRGHERPAAATWAAAGIGLVAQSFINGGVYFIVTMVTAAIADGGIGLIFFGGEPAPLAIFAVLALGVASGIGALCWMAFARGASASGDTAQRPQAAAGASMTS